MRREILVFDIETIIDADAARALLRQQELSDAEARDALERHYLDKTDGRSSFPRQPFHQVIAISYAHLSREPGEQGTELVIQRIASGGRAESSERELLEGFFGFIEQRAPQLVSFNGRSFDIPVLKYRAMKHHLRCPRWFNEGDKWNNYDARYADSYHLDLLERLSDYGASARCSMDEIAAVFGVPGKLDTSGDDVRALFEQGRIDDIRAYCETDVCSTLLILLRWMLFAGQLHDASYARIILGLRHYLEAEQETRPHLGVFLQHWDACRS